MRWKIECIDLFAHLSELVVQKHLPNFPFSTPVNTNRNKKKLFASPKFNPHVNLLSQYPTIWAGNNLIVGAIKLLYGYIYWANRIIRWAAWGVSEGNIH